MLQRVGTTPLISIQIQLTLNRRHTFHDIRAMLPYPMPGTVAIVSAGPGMMRCMRPDVRANTGRVLEPPAMPREADMHVHHLNLSTRPHDRGNTITEL